MRPRVLEEALRAESRDMDPWTGRVFTHVYDPGRADVLLVAREFLLRNYDKTMLDFIVYPSVVYYERWLVGFLARILGCREGCTGSFTYGGTESILVALLAAREYWRQHGGRGRGRVVLPVTAHPAFRKAAYYLGLQVVDVDVDREEWVVDPASVDRVLEKNSDDVVAVVVSAPNYPYGTVDPVEDVAEITRERGVWLHVDAALGGLIIPFLYGVEKTPRIGFEVDGVFSVNVDLHKYGYAPKGASIILFRSHELKEPTIFVDASWPGYPLVNTSALSTRSAGPLAAAWAVARLLGEDGYRRLAHLVRETRIRLVEGIESTGALSVLGRPVAGTIAFTSDSVDLFRLRSLLAEKGWILQSQPGNKHRGFPPSLHMTISPVHERVVEEFIEDLRYAISRAGGWGWDRVERLARDLGLVGEAGDPEAVARMLGVAVREWLLGGGGGGGVSIEDVEKLIHILPPEVVEKVLRTAVNWIFTPDLEPG